MLDNGHPTGEVRELRTLVSCGDIFLLHIKINSPDNPHLPPQGGLQKDEGNTWSWLGG